MSNFLTKIIQKRLATILLITSIPIVFTIGIFIYFPENYLIRSVLHRLSSDALIKTAMTDKRIAEIKENTKMFSSNMTLLNTLDEMSQTNEKKSTQELERYVELFMANHAYENCIIVDDKGNIVLDYKNRDVDGTNILSGKYETSMLTNTYKKVLETKQTTTCNEGEILFENDKTAFNVGMPIVLRDKLKFVAIFPVTEEKLSAPIPTAPNGDTLERTETSYVTEKYSTSKAAPKDISESEMLKTRGKTGQDKGPEAEKLTSGQFTVFNTRGSTLPETPQERTVEARKPEAETPKGKGEKEPAKSEEPQKTKIATLGEIIEKALAQSETQDRTKLSNKLEKLLSSLLQKPINAIQSTKITEKGETEKVEAGISRLLTKNEQLYRVIDDTMLKKIVTTSDIAITKPNNEQAVDAIMTNGDIPDNLLIIDLNANEPVVSSITTSLLPRAKITAVMDIDASDDVNVSEEDHPENVCFANDLPSKFQTNSFDTIFINLPKKPDNESELIKGMVPALRPNGSMMVKKQGKSELIREMLINTGCFGSIEIRDNFVLGVKLPAPPKAELQHQDDDK